MKAPINHIPLADQAFPPVYIIILNYRNWQETKACLETVLRLSYPNFRTIVVDNASGNGSLESIRQWAEQPGTPTISIQGFTVNNLSNSIDYQIYNERELSNKFRPGSLPTLSLVQNEYNHGFAGGINTVLKYLLPEQGYAWLLNPDMLVESSALDSLVTFAREQLEDKAIIGSLIRYYLHPTKVHLYGGGRINFNSATIEMIREVERINELDYISGGALFTSLASYRDLGLLPEQYFLYWEETDWCYRAKAAGYHLLVCLASVCYDKVSSSIGKNFTSDYYYTRNGLLFLEKFQERKIPAAVFFTFLRLAKRLLTAQFGRAKGMWMGMRSYFKRGRHAVQ